MRNALFSLAIALTTLGASPQLPGQQPARFEVADDGIALATSLKQIQRRFSSGRRPTASQLIGVWVMTTMITRDRVGDTRIFKERVFSARDGARRDDVPDHPVEWSISIGGDSAGPVQIVSRNPWTPTGDGGPVHFGRRGASFLKESGGDFDPTYYCRSFAAGRLACLWEDGRWQAVEFRKIATRPTFELEAHWLGDTLGYSSDETRCRADSAVAEGVCWRAGNGYDVANFGYRDGRLYRMRFELDSSGYIERTRELRARYGKPSIRSEPFTTAGGVTIDNTVLRWQLCDGTLEVRRYGASLDRVSGEITIADGSSRTPTRLGGAVRWLCGGTGLTAK
jgi:hypothetical protein